MFAQNNRFISSPATLRTDIVDTQSGLRARLTSSFEEEKGGRVAQFDRDVDRFETASRANSQQHPRWSGTEDDAGWSFPTASCDEQFTTHDVGSVRGRNRQCQTCTCGSRQQLSTHGNASEPTWSTSECQVQRRSARQTWQMLRRLHPNIPCPIRNALVQWKRDCRYNASGATNDKNWQRHRWQESKHVDQFPTESEPGLPGSELLELQRYWSGEETELVSHRPARPERHDDDRLPNL